MADGLGDRIKKYEKAFNPAFPIKLPLILRLDGRSFHTMVKKWKCLKPFDENLIEAMLFTAKTLCENIAGAHVAYVQSDEITILVRDDMGFHSQPWYDKKINKIMSVAAAKASNAFNFKFHGSKKLGVDVNLNELAEFDCRGFIVPEHEINNVIIWRQQDASRNSIQMLARSNFSHNQLNKKNNSEIQDMLMSLDPPVNWNDLDTHLKRGACIIKKDDIKQVPKRDEKGKVIPGEFSEINRPAWVVDKEIPIFTQDKNYINQFAYIKE
jgi:tRNA(His) 5'-end guanylyltransferase